MLQGHELLQFARECVVGYLEDKDPVTRREAAICCCRLVEHSVSTARASGASSRLWATQNARGTTVGDRRRRFLIEEVHSVLSTFSACGYCFACVCVP